ncbi:MAG: hypothetical protein M3162_04715 [Thermoproteota archaeon]|nr:hypothetical protein [Thermoproteota archaeon]
MNKLVFVVLALVLASAFFVGNNIVFERAEAVGEKCPSKNGKTASEVNPPSSQQISAQFSNTQII